MGLIQRARASLRPEQRAFSQFGSSAIPPNSLVAGEYSANGSIVAEGGALGVSTVLSCMRVLHDDVAMMPFAAYTGSRHGPRQPLADQPPIITEPFGPDVPAANGFGQLVVSMKLRGNAYLGVLAEDGGYPSQLQVLHPDWVQPRVDDRRGKIYRVNGMDYEPHWVKHIPGMMLPGAIVGIDPISFMRVALSSAADVAAYGGNFFRNGANPSVVIEVPGPGSRAKARDVKADFEGGHAGVANAHRPAVVFGGAKITALSVTPENAQFLQTRQFSREEICGWLGVPLQRIMAIVDNASQGGGKGLDAIDQGYATHTLTPIVTPIEALWNTFLPGGQRSWTLFDFGALLRANAVERAQIAQIHRLTGVRNRNEIRADEGWEPIPGPDGEDYNVPFNTNSAVPPLKDPNTGEPVSPAGVAS